MIKRIALAVVCSFVWARAAQAQACLGGLGFNDAPTQVGGLFTTSSDEHTFSGGVSHGTKAFFVDGAATFLSLDGVNATGVEALAGHEIRLQAHPKLSICPIVSVSKIFGPSPAPDLNDGELLFAFGAAVGFDAAKSGTTRIVPTFGITYDHVHQSESGTDAFGNPATGSFGESSEEIQLGVGLIFNERMSLIPVFIIPFGSDIGENVFSVTFSTTLHHR